MSINKPFHRNYRPVKDGFNSGYSDWAYIIDKEYAKNPEHYVRAFLMIQKDIINLFEYIEPSDICKLTYSFRIHELLIRICVEVEANFKAILKENIYNPKKRDGSPKREKEWNINNFRIVNKSHHLDNYAIELPFWKGKDNIRRPFIAWKKPNTGLTWYQAYNKSKHDRLTNFQDANLNNLMDAFAGLHVLLTSQFRDVDFQPGPDNLQAQGYNYFRTDFGIGDYLMVDFPTNWTDSEKYEFNWADLKKEKVRFQKIDYDKL